MTSYFGQRAFLLQKPNQIMYSMSSSVILRRTYKYGSRTNMRWIVFRNLALQQHLHHRQYALHLVPFSRLFKSLLLIGMASTLASCSQIQHYKKQFLKQKPEKVFQYAYQEPKRSQLAGTFARQLAIGEQGSLVTIRLSDKSTARARLGRQYFSASGYACRKYTLQGSPQPQTEYASCLVNGRWLDTSPITHNANFTQHNPQNR